MSTHDFSRWTAQKPPDDFAARTVDAMVADAGRHKRRGLGKHWFGGLLLAAALVGTSAWGMLGQHRDETPQPAVVQRTGLRAPPTLMHPSARAQAPAAEPAPEPTPPAPPAWRPAVRPAPPPATASAEPVVTPPPFVHVPRCACQPGVMMCGCVE